ncbi:MAG: nucleotidyl transferase AbiEii/AbiGii toxin family protein [Motiliproteus sp.]
MEETTLESNGMTPEQKQHIEIMRLIAQSFSDTPMILKGGTSLLLGYGLNRYSEDLDFDSTKAINVDARIVQALRTTKISIESNEIKKDTDTVKRWVLRYKGPDGDGSLKIEVSLRQGEISEDLITEIAGIKIYHIESLITQKLNAADNRAKVRDLYDIEFLARQYGDHFNLQQIERLVGLAEDPAEIVERYMLDHSEDSILSFFDLDDLAMALYDQAERLSDPRN